MEKMPLNIHDLVPRESAFNLSGLPGKELVLCNWSLRVRAWASARYGSEGLKDIFEKQKIEQIADIAYFMLKPESKSHFPTLPDFLNAVITMTDQINVIKALLVTIGIGEPEIEKIGQAFGEQTVEKKAATDAPKSRASKTKTGRKRSTP